MELLARNFPNIGVVEGKLSEEIVDDLWTLINEAREQPEDMKPELAGNISSSIRLDSKSDLIEDFVGEVIPAYMRKHLEEYGSPYRLAMKESEGFNLESLWVNFQKQNEFNPPHDHAGVYSFEIWMQIPTSYEEQRKLPICAEANADNHISNFAFNYTNTLGRVSTFAYNMEKQAEGYMVMFPSCLLHQVFPFYNDDGERISISGNINIGEMNNG